MYYYFSAEISFLLNAHASFSSQSAGITSSSRHIREEWIQGADSGKTIILLRQLLCHFKDSLCSVAISSPAELIDGPIFFLANLSMIRPLVYRMLVNSSPRPRSHSRPGCLSCKVQRKSQAALRWRQQRCWSRMQLKSAKRSFLASWLLGGSTLTAGKIRPPISRSVQLLS